MTFYIRFINVKELPISSHHYTDYFLSVRTCISQRIFELFRGTQDKIIIGKLRNVYTKPEV